MINIISNKGITMVSLVITIVLLSILTGTITYNISLSNGLEEYNNMIADINLLKDKIIIYHNKYGEIPVTNRKFNLNETEYKEIDLKKLENITLNYGDEYGQEKDLTTNSDVYLIDSNLNIYYLKGIKKSGEIYHKQN